MRFDVVGPQGHGTTVVGRGLRRLACEKQKRSEVVVSLRVIGIESKRRLEFPSGLVAPVAGRVGNAEVVVR